MSITQMPIVDGHGKFELFSQLHDIGRVHPRPAFELTVQCPGFHRAALAAIDVYINGISAEDGSGNNWLFRGYVVVGNNSWLLKFLGDTRSFTGYYNTRTRKGSLEVGG